MKLLQRIDNYLNENINFKVGDIVRLKYDIENEDEEIFYGHKGDLVEVKHVDNPKNENDFSILVYNKETHTEFFLSYKEIEKINKAKHSKHIAQLNFDEAVEQGERQYVGLEKLTHFNNNEMAKKLSEMFGVKFGVAKIGSPNFYLHNYDIEKITSTKKVKHNFRSGPINIPIDLINVLKEVGIRYVNKFTAFDDVYYFAINGDGSETKSLNLNEAVEQGQGTILKKGSKTAILIDNIEDFNKFLKMAKSVNLSFTKSSGRPEIEARNILNKKLGKIAVSIFGKKVDDFGSGDDLNFVNLRPREFYEEKGYKVYEFNQIDGLEE